MARSAMVIIIVVLPTGRYVTYFSLPGWRVSYFWKYICMFKPSVSGARRLGWFVLHRIAPGREIQPVMSRYSGVKRSKYTHIHTLYRYSRLWHLEPRMSSIPTLQYQLVSSQPHSVFPHMRINISHLVMPGLFSLFRPSPCRVPAVVVGPCRWSRRTLWHLRVNLHVRKLYSMSNNQGLLQTLLKHILTHYFLGKGTRSLSTTRLPDYQTTGKCLLPRQVSWSCDDE